MDPEDEWLRLRADRGWRVSDAGMGLLRVVLLFGFIAVAFALILVPIADNQTRSLWAGDNGPMSVDMMQTAQIQRGVNYVIRQSVLQPTPSALCMIKENGERSGDC